MIFTKLGLRTVSLVALLAAGTAFAQNPPSDPAMEAEAAARDANRSAPKPDATFQYGETATQSAELRLPKGNGPFPVAVILHGGCFVKGLGGTGMQSMAEMLRQRGIATWDIDYRRLGHEGGGWPGTFQDIARGVDYLGTLAGRYPLDLGRVSIMGHSAGAPFAFWSASRAKLAGPFAATERTPKFRSAVAIDGPAALSPYVEVDKMVCGDHVITKFMGGSPADRPGAYRQAEMISRMPLGIRQLYIRGSLGPLLDPWLKKVENGPDKVMVLSPKGADHFDITTGGKPNGEAVADWIRDNAF